VNFKKKLLVNSRQRDICQMKGWCLLQPTSVYS